MGELHGSRTEEKATAPSVTTDEQSRLDAAMLEMDERLLASLREDEVRRRRRHRLLGGFVMIACVTSVASIVFFVLGNAEPTTQRAPSADDIDQAAAHTQRGWEQWQKSRWSDAEGEFDKAVKLDPESTNAWNGLGWARFNGSKTLEAKEAFAKCLALEKTHPAALNGMGQVCFVLRQYEDAKKYLSEAAKQGAPAAWYSLARAYLLTGAFKDAQPWCQKLADGDKDNKLYGRMLAAAEEGKLDAKLKAEIEPPVITQSSPETQRGWQLFFRQDYARAAREFEKAIKKNPQDANAHNGLGFCHLNRGHYDVAMKSFERCLQLEPKHAGAMNGKARCLKGKGKIDEAIALWKEMLEMAPGPNAATDGLAWTYLEHGEYDQAVPYFEQLAKADPNNTYIQDGLRRARAGAKKGSGKP